MASAHTERPAVAIAHDYLTQRGGAERVVLAISDAFPDAAIHTSCFEASQTFAEFSTRRIATTLLDRIGPIRRDPRKGVLLLAPAFSSHRVDAEVVVASSSAWAHGVSTDAKVLVYCHSPARWLYRADRYGSPGRGGRSLGAAASVLTRTVGIPVRRWDARAMRRADRVVVNSTAIAGEVAEIYGIEAEVVPPPPALVPGGPTTAIPGLEPGYWLTVARLLPYKNLHAILEVAALRPAERFVIVGDGPLRADIEADAPPNVRLVTSITDAELRWLYQEAAALVAPAQEDFGLTPLEAACFATPTVALRSRGHLDTIVEGVTGAFFDRADGRSIDRALVELGEMRLAEQDLLGRAEDFSRERFIQRMQGLVAELATS